jgi:HEAT repeat protein
MPRSLRCFLALLFITTLAIPVLAMDQAQLQKAREMLEAGVKEKSSAKRHDAIHALGLLAGDSKAVAIAESALNDHAPEVREAAASTLGQLHSSSSIPKLELALNDKEISVVLASAHSLWTLHDKEGYEVYYEILLGERKGGKGLIAGQEEMFKDRKKLATFGFEQAVGFSIFSSVGWEIFQVIRKDDVSPVRAAAATVLADDPDPRSGQALVKSCSDKSWIVRVAALDALARRGDRAFLPDIEPHTADEKDRVRYTAAAAIIRLNAAPPRAKQLAEKTSNR